MAFKIKTVFCAPSAKILNNCSLTEMTQSAPITVYPEITPLAVGVGTKRGNSKK